MTDLNIEGMAIAPNVVETIVLLAVKDVDGVSLMGASNNAKGAKGGILALFGNKAATPAVEISVSDDNKMTVSVHIQVKYTSVLPEVAANVRKAVADAVSVQVGVEVAAVDVYIDGIQFDN